MWDFICLQEVDLHDSIFNESDDYRGTLAMKQDNVMGCAIYYNSNKFAEVGMETFKFVDPESGSTQSQLAMIGKYQHKETQKIYLLV